MRITKRRARRPTRRLQLAERAALDCFDARRISNCFTLSLGHLGAVAACAVGAAFFLFGRSWIGLI
jgi:hypothetical protein